LFPAWFDRILAETFFAMDEKERIRLEEEFKLLRELGQAENEALNRLIIALNNSPDKGNKKNAPTDTSKPNTRHTKKNRS
jgi:hypothetical protein